MGLRSTLVSCKAEEKKSSDAGRFVAGPAILTAPFPPNSSHVRPSKIDENRRIWPLRPSSTF